MRRMAMGKRERDRRLQSRALDAIALWHRHASRSPGPCGRTYRCVQCAIESRADRDHPARESDRLSDRI